MMQCCIGRLSAISSKCVFSPPISKVDAYLIGPRGVSNNF